MIQDQHPHLHLSAFSHPGEKRTHNEDSYRIMAYKEKGKSTPILLAVLADGIGGHQAGEIASQITTDSIIEKLSDEELRDPIRQLSFSVEHASSAVVKASLETPEYYGMGSTVAIAWIIGRRLYTTHVGDSRIYLLRNGRIRQITTDHTWIQEAIERDIIRPEDAQNHPRAHIIQRAIGSPEPPEPDFRMRLADGESDQVSITHQGLKLSQGDQILLCSDGLTDLVSDKEIQSALEDQQPQEAVQSLVTLARARGGHDNITVIILTAPPEWARSDKLRAARVLLLMALALLTMVMLASLGIYLSGWRPSLTWINDLLPVTHSPTSESTIIYDPTAGVTSLPLSPSTEIPSSQLLDSAIANFVATPLPSPDWENAR